MSQNIEAADLIGIRPLAARLIVDIVDRGERTVGGIIVPDDDFKEHGARPRRALVLAVGPKAREDGIQPGQTVLLEHGGWTHNTGQTAQDLRTGEVRKIWMSESKFVLGLFDEA